MRTAREGYEAKVAITVDAESAVVAKELITKFLDGGRRSGCITSWKGRAGEWFISTEPVWIVDREGASQPKEVNPKEEGLRGSPLQPGAGITGAQAASMQESPAPGPFNLPYPGYVRALEEQNEALRDELFWTRRRAEQAEQDAARWLERLSDLEDLVEAAGWNLRRAK